jgi:hypothetical protein
MRRREGREQAESFHSFVVRTRRSCRETDEEEGRERIGGIFPQLCGKNQKELPGDG